MRHAKYVKIKNIKTFFLPFIKNLVFFEDFPLEDDVYVKSKGLIHYIVTLLTQDWELLFKNALGTLENQTLRPMR